jgi:hypothetical protein
VENLEAGQLFEEEGTNAMNCSEKKKTTIG